MASPPALRRHTVLLLLTALAMACGGDPNRGPPGASEPTVQGVGQPAAPGERPDDPTDPADHAPDAPPPSGADVLGRSVVGQLPDRFLDEPLTFGRDQPARATLVRFWTDTCPFCEASLPAIEGLREELGGRGLRTLGVYNPKPARAVSDDQVRAAAERLGYHGPLAIDERWEALQRMWLDGGDRRATSVSFLLDAEGVVRFVHPGPEFHPSSDPDHASCNTDYGRLRAEILRLLGD